MSTATIEATRPTIPFDFHESQTSFLEGEILTIIDATIAEPQRAKSVKDLVRQSFRRRIDYVREWCAPVKFSSENRTARGTLSK